MLNKIIGLGLVAVSLTFYDHDFFTAKWTMAYAVLGTAYLLWLSTRYSLVVIPFAASIVFHTLYIATYSFNHYSTGNAIDLMAYEKLSLLAMMTFVFITILYSLHKKAHLTRLTPYFIAIGLIDAAAIIYQNFAHLKIIGTLGNPSMNASFLAMLSPLCGPYGALFIIPIFYCQSSVGMIAFGVAWACYLLLRHRKYLPALALLAVPPFFIQDFTADSGRYAIWRLGFKYWASEGHRWFGLGPGATRFLLPYSQVKYGWIPHTKEIWIWFHNDFAQVMFEQGIIGMISLLLIVVSAIYLSYRKNQKLLPTVLAMGVVGFFNYPSYMAIQCLFSAWILACIFRKNQSH